jgi:hypothetical protein
MIAEIHLHLSSLRKSKTLKLLSKRKILIIKNISMKGIDFKGK